MKYIYTGWFIDFDKLNKALESINRTKLEKEIKNPHVTLHFRPRNAYEEFFGDKATIKIIGYGNDGINEGVNVKIESNNKTLQNEINEVEVTHITLSTSKKGKPVNTSKLDFKPLQTPIEITGIYKGFEAKY